MFGGLNWEHFNVKAHTFQDIFGVFYFYKKNTMLSSKLILYPDIKPPIYGNCRLPIDKIVEFLVFQVCTFGSVEESCSIPGHNYTLPFSILAVIARLY